MAIKYFHEEIGRIFRLLNSYSLLVEREAWRLRTRHTRRELDCVSWEGDVVPRSLLLCFTEVDSAALLGQREQGGFRGAHSRQWHWRTVF